MLVSCASSSFSFTECVNSSTFPLLATMSLFSSTHGCGFYRIKRSKNNVFRCCIACSRQLQSTINFRIKCHFFFLRLNTSLHLNVETQAFTLATQPYNNIISLLDLRNISDNIQWILWVHRICFVQTARSLIFFDFICCILWPFNSLAAIFFYFSITFLYFPFFSKIKKLTYVYGYVQYKSLISVYKVALRTREEQKNIKQSSYRYICVYCPLYALK